MENDSWWTAPAESEDGHLIMVTGRRDVARFRSNPRFSIRVEVSWKYDTDDPSGMPDTETSRLMEEVQEALQTTFRKDPVAVLTGIFTGDGRRDWVFYTTSTHIFGRKLNESLAHLPLLPLEVYCENDPAWEAYDEMSQAEIKLD
ncbi:MAG: DUF695 domain-containing protein [Bacteroides sp.]|nr:DUF695 domain-containing protein [Bacteroides sp.]MBD5271379.1 DUF695 domain-containing protein [Bacteroides sp.]MBD5333095.1 DUF695 domain-containing protein [Bacteroides sp.]